MRLRCHFGGLAANLAGGSGELITHDQIFEFVWRCLKKFWGATTPIGENKFANTGSRRLPEAKN